MELGKRMRKLLSKFLFLFLLSACTAGTGGSPLGGPLGGAGLGSDGSVGGGNAAAPEQDSGVVYPQADPNWIVIQIQCSMAKCTFHQPIYGVDGEPVNQDSEGDEICLSFKAYLGHYLNDFVTCCNERVVRFVDPVLNRYVDYVTGNLEGLDGGFEPKLPGDHAAKLTVHLAPEGTLADAAGTWQDCDGECVPEDWRKFDSPWSHPSCGFMNFENEENTFQYQKLKDSELLIQKK